LCFGTVYSARLFNDYVILNYMHHGHLRLFENMVPRRIVGERRNDRRLQKTAK
jgi:hypothetical protein